MDTVGKLLGLLEVGQLALHPDGIAVRCVGNGSVDRAVAAALEAVVPLARARRIPVEEDVPAEDIACDGAGLGIGLALCLGEVRLLLLVLGGGRRSVDGGEDGVIEALEVGAGEPVVLDALQLLARLTLLLSSNHEVVQGLEVRVGGADNEGMVAGVNCRGDEGCGFGVSTSDGKKIGSFILRSV